ncbi:ThuA domain-containing protein [Albibacterium indicum]|uniref:ThuA domain-containing protein n=1 Tax=Albibacterium indicum TaxID=2292082 RepID=UPI001FED01BE|nr:ThuA domain-containing protein [Pedobacter indicus]
MPKTKFLMQVLLFFFFIGTPTAFAHPPAKALKNSKILLYTKNGKGFVHDNIASAVEAIKKLGEENRFQVVVSDDPSVFTEDNLKQYKLLVFASTNNDVFDTDEQRVAFRRYIQAGGGFVGIHSVTGTERNWTWFKKMIGGTFSWHAVLQDFKVINIRPEHPSMEGVPKEWIRKDECYFTKEMYPGIVVLMAHDLTSLDMTLRKDQKALVEKHSAHFGELYPAVWYQKFDGGNIWVTTLGHMKESYEDPQFMKHILQGINHVASETKKLDYSKAYATDRDDAVRY